FKPPLRGDLVCCDGQTILIFNEKNISPMVFSDHWAFLLEIEKFDGQQRIYTLSYDHPIARNQHIDFYRTLEDLFIFSYRLPAYSTRRHKGILRCLLFLRYHCHFYGLKFRPVGVGISHYYPFGTDASWINYILLIIAH